MALAKSLNGALSARPCSVPAQSFFRIHGTARRETAAGAKKGRGNGAVKMNYEDQQLFHAQTPAFLKSLMRSSSMSGEVGIFGIARTFTKQTASG